MATTTEPRASFSLGQRIVGGVVGGIAGGLVFGAMMAAMGMLPMVASVVGSNSALIGFLYHMFNSVVIGAIFGLLFGAQRTAPIGWEQRWACCTERYGGFLDR
jgi:hypothetical protein